MNDDKRVGALKHGTSNKRRASAKNTQERALEQQEKREHRGEAKMLCESYMATTGDPRPNLDHLRSTVL